MKFHKKSRPAPAIIRGRFVLHREADVLDIYRGKPDGSVQLVASIEPRGGRGQIRLISYQRTPIEVASGHEALQMMRVMRRYG